MIKYFVFITVNLAACFLTACEYGQIDPPEVILEDSLLVKILTDSYILNAAFHQTAGSVKDSIGKAYKQQILDKYQISRVVLDQNVEWLYAHPDKLDSIFQMMLDRMDTLETQISEKADNVPN